MDSNVAKLSPLQLEFIRVYSFKPTDEDMQSIKKMLAEYFSNKLIAKVDKAVEEKSITDKNLENWLNEEF